MTLSEHADRTTAGPHARAAAQLSARQHVARSLCSGWTEMSEHELAAVQAWYQTKAAQETGSWPITTAVVGSAAVVTAYMYEHGIADWDSLGGVMMYAISLVAVACAVLTVYRLLAIWHYERRYAEATYWLSLGPARRAHGDWRAETDPGNGGP